MVQGRRTKAQTKRRWKVERLFAWLHNFRRIITRWDVKASNYLAFVHLCRILILPRRL